MNKQPFLYNYQMDAVKQMRNGCILNGGVGSGKSRTGLYYYFKEQGGSMDPDYIAMKNPKDLYIITTAMKRDSCEWEGELSNFLISKNPEVSNYKNKVVIDSWNKWFVGSVGYSEYQFKNLGDYRTSVQGFPVLAFHQTKAI